MTSAEFQAIKKTIILAANYYGRELKPEVVVMMAEDLADLPYSKVQEAFAHYRKTSKFHRMPATAEIRAFVEPSVDPDSAAREIAARVQSAIVKFGWCNSHGAREYIGEIGWTVVERQGGWPFICENHGINLDTGVFQAQVRELAKSTLINDQRSMEQAIGIRPRESAGELESSENVMRRMLSSIPTGEGA